MENPTVELTPEAPPPLPPWQVAFRDESNKDFPRYGKPLSEFNVREIEEIRARAYWLLCIIECQPGSREISIARTKLEESVMWAVKAITG